MKNLEQGIFGPDPDRPWYPNIPETLRGRGLTVNGATKDILENQVKRLEEEFGINEVSGPSTEVQI